MNRRIITTTLLGIVLVALGCASQPYGDTGAKWVTLIDGGTGLDNWIRVGDANWRVVDGDHPSRQEDRQGEQFSGYEKLVYRFSNPRRVLGQRRRQLRYLYALRRHQESDRSDMLRSEHLRSAPGPDLWHWRHRSSVAGVADAEGGRQMEHLTTSRSKARV